MKNIKNFILINRNFASTTLAKIKEVASGRILILGASGRKDMEEALNALIGEFERFIIRLSPLLSLKPKEVDLKNPGFNMVMEIEKRKEADTLIIVGNTYYIVGLLCYLQLKAEIGLSLIDIVVKPGEVLHIKNEHKKEVHYLKNS